MGQSLISIIVPIYKVEPYLHRCVDSIINQTYQDLEIILVDDGSPDNCPQICDEYQQKDSRIKVIHKPNGGLSDARNAGLDIAQGEYIIFVDSDDFIHPEMAAVLFELLQKNGSDIAICNFVPFTHDVTTSNEAPVVETLSGEEAALRLYQKEYTTQSVVAWDKIYKKSVFNNLRFKVGKFNEDEFFSYKAMLSSSKITYTSQELYYYFLRDTGISKAITNPKSLDGLEAKQEAIAYYRENKHFALLRAAVSSFLNFTAKRYCFVHHQKGNHKNLLAEIKKHHFKVFSENKFVLDKRLTRRAQVFQFMPLLYWFFIKYDKFRQQIQK
ncbi:MULTISPECIES: glycosyltransferase [unclassified Fibrobacter]|uniref:glycosyltransferase family 2 protein n=1 Tax=unclassified Fibrobacter TaxID=2634177 RepID=UPI00091A285B|nr:MULTISPECIES: glycosyltransferase [unclassified Fibrobacter]SHK75992.1 Glycosyltransferase involved in cell wall bisynthesis [Fibrobacter sp. UWB12]SIO38497.1 Glycosyltransferase involved in cell wall bisynthesis [Fibrobacter sp. UWB11]